MENNNQNYMKKIIIIGCLVIILAVGVVWRVFLYKEIPTPTSSNKTEEVLDLSELEQDTERTQLLNSITGKYYNYADTYLLDDNDPSTRVTIEVYGNEYRDGKDYPGGIVMLKRLPNGKDSIFWEITSPLLSGDSGPRVLFVKDINKDGLKEIVTVWGDNAFGRSDHFFYWILTVDPRNKKYKVLNPITDKDGKLIANIDFEHFDTSKDYNNKLEVYLLGAIGKKDIIEDIDNDGIFEIAVNYENSKKIYKWNGTKYFLWKTSPTPFAPYSPF